MVGCLCFGKLTYLSTNTQLKMGEMYCDVCGEFTYPSCISPCQKDGCVNMICLDCNNCEYHDYGKPSDPVLAKLYMRLASTVDFLDNIDSDHELIMPLERNMANLECIVTTKCEKEGKQREEVVAALMENLKVISTKTN